MRILRTTGRRAAVVAIGLVTAACAGGTAYAATGSGPAPGGQGTRPSGVASQTARHPGRPGRSLLQRADHATVEVRVKGRWVTYTLDRGRVTAVSPTSITLSRPDGQSVTDAIGPSTKYEGVGSETAVQLHRPATVLSDAGTALRVRQRPAAAAGARRVAPA